MYPQPATTQTAPARPKWQLAGRAVTQFMYYDAEKAKRANKRVFFVTAGYSDLAAMSDDDCRNCGGFGRLGLEVAMLGPLKEPPQTARGNAEIEPDMLIRPAWHNGAWWGVTRQMYPCPVCKDTEKK